MPAPNRQRDLVKIWIQMGRPELDGEGVFSRWTAQAVACLAFGAPAWGIVGDPRWGRRRNSTGTISKDTLRYGRVQAVDTASGAGLPGWQFQWLTYEPGEDGFGVGRLPAKRRDLPPGSQDEVVDPPPPPPNDEHPLQDIRDSLERIEQVLARVFK
ncbi:hypothetical protein LCGC14_0723160 [marine sediment metagenome]|uniref:Uncharacterized protein n=1 Tax=marine sediment metagenome TaxID=412755 RepID=A0A0F9QBT4_9ZZZZ